MTVSDSFYQKTNCDRCNRILISRIMSWFTDEALCGECSDIERKLKTQMKEKGMNPYEYEGCGYIPKAE